jgi:putative ABC transport system ATP-binding protein
VDVDQEGFTFDEVVVDRGEVRALDGFSAHVPASGITALFGPSGSGKTTLLRLCNRLEVPTAGRVYLNGEDVAGLDPLGLRRRVGMVFQRPAPFPGTVRDNLAVAAPDAPAEELDRALEAAALDGSWLDRDAGGLSGGEAQRVCLARTLVTRPHVLLLDEPTSSLDETAARQIENAVRDLAGNGIAVLWVSHDPRQVRRIADQVVGIDHGRRVDPGQWSELEEETR